MPLLDPDPVDRAARRGRAPRRALRGSRRARGRADPRRRARQGRAGARGARARAGGPIDPAPILDALRAAFPACYCCCVGTPELAFVGASPELLVRRDGARAQTVALAGTTRRSADPAVDDHLGEQLLRSDKDREEQAIVTRADRAHARAGQPLGRGGRRARCSSRSRTSSTSRRRSAPSSPSRCPRSSWRAALHPTPAVGGEPQRAAAAADPGPRGPRPRLVRRRGRLDRPRRGRRVLRRAPLRPAARRPRAPLRRLRHRRATPSPPQELAETEVKLQALLPLLPNAEVVARRLSASPRPRSARGGARRCSARSVAHLDEAGRSARRASRSSLTLEARRCAMPASAASARQVDPGAAWRCGRS